MDTNAQFRDCIRISYRSAHASDSPSEPSIWSSLPWKRMEHQTFRLQKRIYNTTRKLQQQRHTMEIHPSPATQSLIKTLGKQLNALQKLLLYSRSTLLLAIRAITSQNQGYTTAGIDGELVLSNEERIKLVNTINIREHKPQAVKRAYIPKRNGTMRPLGIPTIKDRIVQLVYKIALEPEWEAKFSPTSYGFRPGRSPQDAINLIVFDLNTKKKWGYEAWILNADLHGAFDYISHKYILKQLSPLFRPMVTKWLEADIWEKGCLFPSREGTPQGGVISPLLANIALHFIDVLLDETGWTENRFRWPWKKKGVFNNLRACRYADDFVVISPHKEPLEKLQQALKIALKRTIGVSLNEEKTYISHTLPALEKIHLSEPCYFLGFRIQARKMRKKDAMYIHVDPDPSRMKKFYHNLKEFAWENMNIPYEDLIKEINMKVRGWGNYYRRVNSKVAFQHMDWQIYRLMKWLVWRKTGRRWQKRWRNFIITDSNRRLLFGTEKISILLLTDAMIEYDSQIIMGETPYGIRRKTQVLLKPWYPRIGVSAFKAQRRTANDWKKYRQHVAICR